MKKILVVDDEPLNINILVELLKDNYKMMAAKSGKQALKAACSSNRPDLILLDIMMPEMDGYEVCRLLKEDASTKDIPVIFVSAMSETVNETKGFELGAVDYITKPISPSIVKARVHTHLELRSLIDYAQETEKKTRESIEFSSLIQNALLPPDRNISQFFDDYFMVWEPKDIVGGDIYQFIQRDDDCLMFVIDCTGHGVPGAFMTMITKTLIQTVVNESNFNNPALIMQELGRNIKRTLNHDTQDSHNDVGFDGGILYYNKKENKVIYAGAKTPMIYVQNDQLEVFKSDRESVGYKRSDMHFEFTNLEIAIETETSFYIATDGFTDQSGGENKFGYGKKRLSKLIHQNYQKSFPEQKELFMKDLFEYQGECDRYDDITFFGCTVKRSS